MTAFAGQRTLSRILNCEVFCHEVWFIPKLSMTSHITDWRDILSIMRFFVDWSLSFNHHSVILSFPVVVRQSYADGFLKFVNSAEYFTPSASDLSSSKRKAWILSCLNEKSLCLQAIEKIIIIQPEKYF